jgi:hypothetical protein
MGQLLYSNHDIFLENQSVIRDTFHGNDTHRGVSDRFHENVSESVTVCSFLLKLYARHTLFELSHKKPELIQNMSGYFVTQCELVGATKL